MLGSIAMRLHQKAGSFGADRLSIEELTELFLLASGLHFFLICQDYRKNEGPLKATSEIIVCQGRHIPVIQQ